MVQDSDDELPEKPPADDRPRPAEWHTQPHETDSDGFYRAPC